MQATGLHARWVNSDRQLADILTKPTVSPAAIMALQKFGKWKIVWDKDFVSAKKLRKKAREDYFKRQSNLSKGSPQAATTKRRRRPMVSPSSSQRHAVSHGRAFTPYITDLTIDDQ